MLRSETVRPDKRSEFRKTEFGPLLFSCRFGSIGGALSSVVASFRPPSSNDSQMLLRFRTRRLDPRLKVECEKALGKQTDEGNPFRPSPS